MTGEKVNFKEASAAESERKNERSSVDFPYVDLDGSISVARALYDRVGLGIGEIEDVAVGLNQTVGGALRLKISAARQFGLLEKDGRAGYKLSDLGQQILSPDAEPRARVDAFLNVPLYAQIYERYKGKLLPPAKALEREMASIGVAAKQADRARQTFERAARQAGFSDQGSDRIVQPRFDRVLPSPPATPATPTVTSPQNGGSGGGHSGDGGGEVKPLKYMLIDLLDPSTMTKEEQDAVYLLINYLARGKKPAPDKAEAAQDPLS